MARCGRKKKNKQIITLDHIETLCIKIFGAVVDSILSDPKFGTWSDKTKQEDMLWLLSDNNKHPFSFLRICEMIEINNPDKIRMILITLSRSKDEESIRQKKIIRNIVREIFFESTQGHD